uniref:Uncharacterized protein n=1 Tax=Rhizophora mucronata TaxID=61149 RepID=A0A2P2J1P1_RHIMU
MLPLYLNSTTQLHVLLIQLIFFFV